MAIGKFGRGPTIPKKIAARLVWSRGESQGLRAEGKIKSFHAATPPIKSISRASFSQPLALRLCSFIILGDACFAMTVRVVAEPVV
jgi:hypothetical protein